MPKNEDPKVPSVPLWDPVKFGLDEAMWELDRGRKVPAYLRDALERFGLARTKRIDVEFNVLKMVDRARQKGHPKTRAPGRTSEEGNAFEVVAEKLKMKPATIERHYQRAKRRDRSEPE